MPIRFAVLVSALVANVAGPVIGDDALPEFREIRELVNERLSGGRNNFPNRLLSQDDVEPVLAAVAELGWEVPDAKAVVDRFLPGSDPLVRELRRSRDAEFAKSIARLPGVYDRLDRLRRMPYGMRRIREFATNPGGSKMLEYMTTTKGGAQLEKQIGRGTDGRGFAQPTNRLYTANDLIDELQSLYEKQNGSAGSHGRGTPTRTPRRR